MRALAVVLVAGLLVAADDAKKDTDRIQGVWRVVSYEKGGKQTDYDWTFAGGKKDALVGKLRECYGHQKDQAEREVDDFIRGL